MIFSMTNVGIWAISALAVAGVISRPFNWPEAIWASMGAIVIVLLGFLPFSLSLKAVAKGSDVYLFLIGMMLLSETARREGLFDWIATLAVNFAKGSASRLFLLIYAVGTLVTIFMSNDATAVVLTPAVFAATKKAQVEPLPFLFSCALIANAASFVLPISNPANLVVYGSHIPALGAWILRFAISSILSIIATFVVLRFWVREDLRKNCKTGLPQPELSIEGWIALCGIGLTSVALLIVSALDIPLGLPSAALGVATAVAVLLRGRKSPWPIVNGVSWAVLPLVAGLFVLVEALGRTGVITACADVLNRSVQGSEVATAAASGTLVAFGSNAINNLPAGLIARSVLDMAHASQRITDSLLIGVDLGPNLSITGSLATILWLGAIRREGEDVNFWKFLKVGVLVMPPALILSIGARLALS